MWNSCFFYSIPSIMSSDGKLKDFFFQQDISDITVQFPSLAQDIKIPKLYPEDRFFSSVFRISSPQGQLWTHYDVSININLLHGPCHGSHYFNDL